MKTIFCDIDGVLLYQPPNYLTVVKGDEMCDIAGAAEKLFEWHNKGYNVILTTGRPEHMRSITIDNLKSQGIMYDVLIMDLGPGPRILINDTDPDHPDEEKAVAINVPRNKGIKSIEL
tara:strand:- start:156987 stop:157340 length:354 start_codon:yes stop_codon:yes gene_type:complete